MAFSTFNPRAAGGGGGVDPGKVFLEFFQGELLPRPAVFSSSGHIS